MASRDLSIDAAEDLPRVLVADDQPHVSEAAEMLLNDLYRVHSARHPREVLECLQADHFDALLIDLNYSRDTTSGQEGLDLLHSIRQLDPEVPVVVMTAWGNVDLAVEAMRRGADDFIQKPWENVRLLAVMKAQVELHRLVMQADRLHAENTILRRDGHNASRDEFIAAAPAMQEVLKLLSKVGPSSANVLVTGEHGTGKEIIAQTLHRLSSRSHRSMIAVNTGALSEGTFESELFGHVKGAFTDARVDRVGRFELADHGTLFLDEIANVPPRQQSKLLRVLETGELERVGSSRTQKVDVRLVSATNADLRRECSTGQFREDLLFRINTVEIHLPGLRERREDIPALAAHFVSRYAHRYRKQIQGFEQAAMQALLQHGWPGNVRELDHTIERGVLMCAGSRISVADLGIVQPTSNLKWIEELTLEEVERTLIRKALARHSGNISLAAETLGLSRGSLYRRMEKYEL